MIKSELRETIFDTLLAETNLGTNEIHDVTSALVERIERDCDVDMYDDEEALPNEDEE